MTNCSPMFKLDTQETLFSVLFLEKTCETIELFIVDVL